MESLHRTIGAETKQKLAFAMKLGYAEFCCIGPVRRAHTRSPQHSDHPYDPAEQEALYCPASNGKAFIGKYVPDYRGAKLYQASPSVSDRFVITANGLDPFAFAAETFRALAPERKQDIETYEKLYSHGMLD